MGCYATVLPGGKPITSENAAQLSKQWRFEVPTSPGLTAAEMIQAAYAGELDVLFSVGGNFLEVLPEPDYVETALKRVPLRVHQDIICSSQMLVDPADTVILIPATTRYEVPGGVTETTTERRVIFSPEVQGNRIGESRPEWEVFMELARKVRPDLAGENEENAPLSFDGTAAIRHEIAQIIPQYAGIQHLKDAGDQFQYGGSHLCFGWNFPTPDGKAQFTHLSPPKRDLPEGNILLDQNKRSPEVAIPDYNALVRLERYSS